MPEKTPHHACTCHRISPRPEDRPVGFPLLSLTRNAVIGDVNEFKSMINRNSMDASQTQLKCPITTFPKYDLLKVKYLENFHRSTFSS